MQRRLSYPLINNTGSVVTSTYQSGVTLSRNADGLSAVGTVTFATAMDPSPRRDRTLAIAVHGLAAATTVISASVEGNSDNLKIYNISQAGATQSLIAAKIPILSKRSSFELTLKFSSNCTVDPRVISWVLTGLREPFPIDVQTSATTVDTVRTVDLITRPGGTIIAISGNDVSAGQSVTWTGDQTPTEDYDFANTPSARTGMRTNSTVDDAANTITATWAVVSTTGVSLLGASFW